MDARHAGEEEDGSVKRLKKHASAREKKVADAVCREGGGGSCVCLFVCLVVCFGFKIKNKK